jgi:hypothetical protein
MHPVGVLAAVVLQFGHEGQDGTVEFPTNRKDVDNDVPALNGG